MKKILMFTRPITPPWDEGSKNLAWGIAKNSSDENLGFSVLTPQNNLDFLENTKNVDGQKIYNSEKFDLSQKIQLLKYFFSLKKDSFDIIHFLFTPRSLTSNFIKSKLKRLNTKTVLTIATLNQEDYEDSNRLKKILFADKIIAQSDYTFNKLNSCGFENVELIYPAIDLNYFKPTEKNFELQTDLNIDHNDFIMLYAGEFTRLDAINDIIETMNILKNSSASLSFPRRRESIRRKNNFKLIIACRIKNKQDAAKKLEVEERIKELKLENKITVIQKPVKILDLYNLSDLSIFPVQKMAGKFDIPLVLAESMACGKPVLASDLPVLKDFIKEEETGYICPKGNPEKLAEKILEIMENKKGLEIISQNALNYAKENFDIQKNVRKYEEIYKNLTK